MLTGNSRAAVIAVAADGDDREATAATLKEFIQAYKSKLEATVAEAVVL